MLMGGHEYFQSAGLSTFLAMANIKLFLTSLTCNSRHLYMLNVVQRFARGGRNVSIIRTKGKKKKYLLLLQVKFNRFPINHLMFQVSVARMH